MLSVTAV